MKSLIVVIAVFFAGSNIFAQEFYTIKGKITDSDKQSVAAGDVHLLNPSDSAVLKHTNILNGNFQLSGIKKGTYLLKISSLGYAVQLETVDLNMNTDVNIQLKRSAAVLGEVTVTA